MSEEILESLADVADFEEKIDLKSRRSKDVEAKADTTVADSTMKDSLGSLLDSSETIELSCCVERVTEDLSSSHRVHVKDRELDLKVVIPSETLFSTLVEAVLQRLGYSDVEALGARGAIVIRNWKPMSLGSITENPWATVGEVLGGLSKLVALKISLCNASKYFVIENIKEKLLYFLLMNSQDLLRSTDCPIKQTFLEECLGEKFDFPNELKIIFNSWYQGQMKTRGTATRKDYEEKSDVDMDSSLEGEISRRNRNPKENNDISYNGSVPSDGAKMVVKRKVLWNDHDSESSKRKYLRDGRGRKLSRHDLDMRKMSRIPEAGIRGLGSVSPAGTSVPELMKMFAEKLHDGTNKTAEEVSLNAGFEDDIPVPELPNKNAVYVIQPLPLSPSGSESVEVVPSDSGSAFDEHSLAFEPQDLSTTVCSSAAEKCESDSNCDASRDREKEKNLDRLSNHNVSQERAIKVMNDKHDSSQSDALDEVHAKHSSITPLDRIGDGNFSRYDDDYVPTNGQKFYRNNSKLPSDLPSFGILPQFQGLIHDPNHQQSALHLYSMPDTVNFMRHLQNSGVDGSNGENRKRSRVFIDPISETPKLEQWFSVDSHPSTSSIEEYTDELNCSVYRQRFPKLEPKNVQLWFKNHRAKVKRLKTECSPASI